MRAILKQSLSPSPADPADNTYYQTSYHGSTTRNERQSPFQDTITTDPVLFGNKPDTRKNTRDTTSEGQNGADDGKNIYDFQGILDDDSIVFINSSGGEDESGVGDC